ncbi:hypothetical protein Pla144_34520 [Bythopirellula polymerisocia]|uniref:Uncharacterized protein n=2 Tax=Bythopirellula polymerisocia TaxID=2528003 RepID=A0A5C6CJE5_9BACT|nr:hypothetical protein Pla144_34520 [Bythopirellula polymerisocia]
MGSERPQGVKRVVWNMLMGFAALAATAAGLSAIMKKGGYPGLGFAAAYISLVLVVQLLRSRKKEVVA